MNEKQLNTPENPNENKVTFYEDDEAYILEDNNEEEINDNLNNEQHKDNFDMNSNKEEDEIKGIDNLSDFIHDKAQVINENNDENNQENQVYVDRNIIGNNQENVYINTQSSNHQNDTNNFNISNNNLISLNYISICQSCRVNFNSYENLPLSFKCGHFFCKNCVIMNYTDSNYKVTCPVDGTTEKSIQSLKILKNLILDVSQDSFDGNNTNLNDRAKTKKNIPESKLYKESSPVKNSLLTGKNSCKFHPNQTLSHFIENTNELICIYCAFNLFKKNPNIDIKELSEKYKEITSQVDNQINSLGNSAETLQRNLNELKKNRLDEEKKINDFYLNLEQLINKKRKDLIDKLNKVFADNSKKIENQLSIFWEKLSHTKGLKSEIDEAYQNRSSFNSVFESYQNLIDESHQDPISTNIDFNEVFFNSENADKISNLILTSGEVKIRSKNKKSMNSKRDYNYSEEINILNEMKFKEALPHKITNSFQNKPPSSKNNEIPISNHYSSSKTGSKPPNNRNINNNFQPIILNSRDSSINQSISIKNYSSVYGKEKNSPTENTYDYLQVNLNKGVNNLSNIPKSHINYVNKSDLNERSGISGSNPPSLYNMSPKKNENIMLNMNQIEDMNLIKYGTNRYNFNNEKYKVKASAKSINNITPNYFENNNIQQPINNFININKYSNPIIDMKYEKIMNNHKGANDNRNYNTSIDNNRNFNFSPSATYNDKCIRSIKVDYSTNTTDSFLNMLKKRNDMSTPKTNLNNFNY